MIGHAFGFPEDCIFRHSPILLAMRSACLQPFFLTRQHSRQRPTTLRSQYEWLHRARAARVLALSRSGLWPQPSTAPLWARLLSCSPYGVVLADGYSRYCRKSLLCPYCWARDYTAPLFAVITQVLARSTAPLRLVVASQRISATEHFRNERQLREFVSQLKQDRQCEAKRVKQALGSFVSYSFDTRRGSDGRRRVQVLRRTLVLATHPPKAPPPRKSARKEVTYLKTYTDLTPKLIAKAVGLSSRFPVGIITNPDLSVVRLHEQLTQQYRFRLRSVTGCLRNSHESASEESY